MIIEDDKTIASILKETLAKWGLNPFYVTEFSNITEQFIKEEPHLVLLDIGLPYYNGYYWCGEIRKISKVPIIFISSNTDNMDIIMAMNTGGDDFITKPFDLNVAVAKVQALLRRTYSYSEQVNIIEHKGGILNLSETTFIYNGVKIDLTKNEFRILEILLEKRKSVVSRDEIMKRLWDDECFIDDNTLTVNITRLRKKLEGAGLTDYIYTKKGLGYMV